MAHKTIIYWRDIPAQVVVKSGRKSEKRELPQLFITAIDRAAMISGASESDLYLAQWRRSDPVACSNNIAAEADKAAEDLTLAYTKERLADLAKAGGWEAGHCAGSAQ